MKSRFAWLLFPLGLGGLIYLPAPILTPFVVGALLAYLSDPPVDRLQAWKLARTPAVVLVFLALILSDPRIAVQFVIGAGGDVLPAPGLGPDGD